MIRAAVMGCSHCSGKDCENNDSDNDDDDD